MFRNREDAGRRLADALRAFEFHDPLVLAIPRGGLATGVVLARLLRTELDVILSKRLRLPARPEVTVGAVSENGATYIRRDAAGIELLTAERLAEERAARMAELIRERARFRAVRPPTSLAHRSVIVVDDGVATGSTLAAALESIRWKSRFDLTVAVPFAPGRSLPPISRRCGKLVCLLESDDGAEIAQQYEDCPSLTEAQALSSFQEWISSAGESRAAPGAGATRNEK